MNRIDWIALAVIGVSALAGLRRGLVGTALALAGIVGGAILGSRIAPHFLHGSSSSRWAAIAALAGAVVGAALGNTIASFVASFVRAGLRLTPLRLFDSVVGLLLGAVAGAALAWVLGAAALQIPGSPSLRASVRASEILRRLDELVPPSKLLQALGRIDPFPSLVGPGAPVAEPTPAILGLPGVAAARGSVVRVVGSACGFEVTGSGWIARRGVVVTAAHVVAGERTTKVQRVGGVLHPAQVVAFDARNDIAVLRVPGLLGAPLPLGPPRPGTAVAIVGFPENGPLDAEPGRVGRTQNVVSQDAYGHGPVLRTMTSVRGLVRHGNSGGPAVDAHGAVLATIFGATRGLARVGLGIPADVVRAVLARARGAAVSTGACST